MKKLAESWRWGAPLARAPGRDGLTFIELQAAKAVINHLGWQLENPLKSPPKPNLSPDVLAMIKDGCRVGIEVTEFCDEKYIKHMQAVKDRKETVARHPRSWSPANIQDKIRASLAEKDLKRHNALVRASDLWCEPLDKYFVVVHTDEALISSQPHVADAALAAIGPLELSQVTRAFFLIWYVQKSVGRRPRIYEIAVDRAT
jgi:hypothetical protein